MFGSYHVLAGNNYILQYIARVENLSTLLFCLCHASHTLFLPPMGRDWSLEVRLDYTNS